MIDVGGTVVSYECDARPTCPACGARWSDEMVGLVEAALGIGCACCNPLGGDVPDIVCHACGKVLYTMRESPASVEPGSGLNLDPD